MKKRYILVANVNAEGHLMITTKAEKMSSAEIIGILEMKQQDLIRLMKLPTDVIDKEVTFIRKRVKEEEIK